MELCEITELIEIEWDTAIKRESQYFQTSGEIDEFDRLGIYHKLSIPEQIKLF